MASDLNISETILDFGKYLLNELPEGYKFNDMDSVINILVTIWNGAVMDSLEGSNRCEKEISSVLQGGQEVEVEDEIMALFNRKRDGFADDLRIVAGYNITKNDDGSLMLKCDCKLVK
ncbi:MAG: hypothetical protein OCC45_16460 [Desulfotalea sp.]